MSRYFNLLLDTMVEFFEKIYTPLNDYFEFETVLLLLFGVALSVRFLLYHFILGGSLSLGSDMANSMPVEKRKIGFRYNG